MNVETNNDENAEPIANDTHEEKAASSWRSHSLAMLALVLALCAIIFSFFNYQHYRSLQTDNTLTEVSARLQTQISGIDTRVSSLDDGLAEIQAEAGALAQQQSSNTERLQDLFQAQGRDNSAWAISEIENLMIMAIHRITLDRDANAALAILQTANNRLLNLGDPGLVNVRRQLTADMNALQSVNVVDITGLSLYLTDFLARVEELPLKPVSAVLVQPDSSGEIPQGTAWQRLLSSVWQEFRSMFVITRTGSNARATMLPDESWFLYQNLRLQIETARLAIMRHDTETLRASLATLKSWLTEYFDASDAGVTNLINTIDRMSRLELDPVLPDISSSLETLRAYSRGRSNQEGN